MTDKPWMLTEEERVYLFREWARKAKDYAGSTAPLQYQTERAAQRRLVEWQDNPCTEHIQLWRGPAHTRRECIACGEQLKKDVGPE